MTTAMVIIAIIFLGGYVWTRSESFKRAIDDSKNAQQSTITGPGAFSFEIVGEASYQKALREISGPGEVRHECTASIHPEDDNPYDNKAVRVDIEGHTVGYFSRADARAYRRKSGSNANSSAKCEAVIIGGGKGRKLGVWLDIDD